VKKLFVELGLQEHFLKYEEESYTEVRIIVNGVVYLICVSLSPYSTSALYAS
jgi:hypothetical protein